MDNAKEVKKGQRKDYLRKRKRRKIEVGVKFYDQWEKIGSLEGLKTDTQIVKFLIQHHLIRHMYTHADERQYACKECGRAFKTPACLKAHERTHKGEKPAQCPY
nr:hypothetical protein BaRGS_010991 [Batillaria attramentaria]